MSWRLSLRGQKSAPCCPLFLNERNESNQINQRNQTHVFNAPNAPNVLEIELDKYPWTGHTAILGKRSNPLITDFAMSHQPSAMSSSDKALKPLAEATIEDVLLHFGDTLNVTRRRHREFMKNGINQGRRPEFQDGGLVRSAGGDKRGLLGRKKEERKKADARILGSGIFVEEILKESDEAFERRNKDRISLDELIRKVTAHVDLDLADLTSSKRNRKVSNARAVISYLAVNRLPAP